MSSLRNLLATGLFVAAVYVSAYGQAQTQYDKGTPPQHLAGVSQIGSYVSSDLGTINLTNGSLNFKIPLGTVGGRGFSIPLTLNYSSKVWSGTIDTERDRLGVEAPVAYADYNRGEDWTEYFDSLARAGRWVECQRSMHGSSEYKDIQAARVMAGISIYLRN